MPPRIVFYSWQTDSDERCNRHFIEDCLKRAIRKLNRDDLSDLVIDRDTKNVPGMPDIGHTILEKIAKSAVVVADLTLINPTGVRRRDERPVSNPNVLFELGYAFGKHGPTAMVGVFNTASGEVEDLPFDLRPKRLMTYQLAVGDDKATVRTQLVDDLAKAIRACLGETEDEQIERNTQIHGLLTDILLFATEIDDWVGITNLPNVLRSHTKSAHELYRLVQEYGLQQGMLNLSSHIVANFEEAETLEMNDINWPRIKECVAAAGSKAGFVETSMGFRVSPESHAECLDQIRAAPSQLQEHIASIQSGTLRLTDLEDLSRILRRNSFVRLVREHPQFVEQLKAVSFDLRRFVLRNAKNAQKTDESIRAIQEIQERLSELVAAYCPSPDAL